MKNLLFFAFMLYLNSVTLGQNAHLGNWNNTPLTDLCISGNYAYCIGNDSLFTLKVSDPKSIGLINKQFVKGARILGDNNYLIIGAADSVIIYSITDPEMPVRISAISLLDYPGFSPEPNEAEIIEFSIQEELLFVLTTYRSTIYNNTHPELAIIDISDINSPTIYGMTGLGSGAQWSRADDMVILNDTAYIIDGYDMGLQIIDVSDKNSISKIGGNGSIMQLGGSIFHISANSNNIFITTHELNEMKICNKSGIVIGTYTFDNSEEKNLISIGNYVYIVSASGIGLIDVTDTDQPNKIDYYATYTNFNNIKTDNQLLYVASKKGLYIFEQYTVLSSVTELEKEIIPSIFPNPTHNFINIDFKNRALSGIAIIDLQGKSFN
ncbi:MAG: hypothetical protein PF517_12995 [Salinivirgaceae bacterium]|jgi:hypothetical protein|nr:hypothetical protein [Salinivirgaceae bacterium]